MPMYAASDDLKVVDGKTVIYLNLARNEKAPPVTGLRLSGPRRRRCRSCSIPTPAGS